MLGQIRNMGQGHMVNILYLLRGSNLLCISLFHLLIKRLMDYNVLYFFRTFYGLGGDPYCENFLELFVRLCILLWLVEYSLHVRLDCFVALLMS